MKRTGTIAILLWTATATLAAATRSRAPVSLPNLPPLPRVSFVFVGACNYQPTKSGLTVSVPADIAAQSLGPYHINEHKAMIQFNINDRVPKSADGTDPCDNNKQCLRYYLKPTDR